MAFDVDLSHDPLPECGCDLCIAAKDEAFERADERTAATIEEVEAWFAQNPDATAFPWERDCTTSLSGCAL